MVIDETTAPSHASSEYVTVILKICGAQDEPIARRELEQVVQLIKGRESELARSI